MCSDCEVYGLKKHGLTRSDCHFTPISRPGAWGGGVAKGLIQVRATSYIWVFICGGPLHRAKVGGTQ